MAQAEFVLQIAPVHSEPSPGGGIRFRSSHANRSVFGVCRCIPGRLVHVRDVAGERKVTGWTVIENGDDFKEKVVRLAMWVSTGKYVGLRDFMKERCK